MFKKAGYEYLLAWKITIPIYDYTVQFCKKHRDLLSSTRTYDQMVQSARSRTQNITEGNQQSSLEGYIKLTGVNKGSLEELLKDYLAFARQNRVLVWSKDRAVRQIRELGDVWEILKKTPTLPDSLEVVVNLMITLVNQAIYLQNRLKASLEKKFVETGGFRENLFKKRMEYLRGKI